MTDIFLRSLTLNKDQFRNLINEKLGIEMEGDYYQDAEYVIYFVDDIPLPYETDNEGNPTEDITFALGVHLNLKPRGEIDINWEGVDKLNINTPYRVTS